MHDLGEALQVGFVCVAGIKKPAVEGRFFQRTWLDQAS